MTTRYFTRANHALADYIETNLPAALRVVETDTSRAANSLLDPEAVVPARLVFDNRTPLIQCFSESMEINDQREGICKTDTTLMISHSFDAQIEKGATYASDYMTAILDCLRADCTLGGTINGNLITSAEMDASFGDVSTTRFIGIVSMTISIHEGSL